MRKSAVACLLALLMVIVLAVPAFADSVITPHADPEEVDLKPAEAMVVWEPKDFVDIESYPDSEALMETVFFCPPEEAETATLMIANKDDEEEYFYQELELDGTKAASRFWFGDYGEAPEDLEWSTVKISFYDPDDNLVGEAEAEGWWDPNGPYEYETVGASELSSEIDGDFFGEDDGSGDFALLVLAMVLFPLLSVGFGVLSGKKGKKKGGDAESDNDVDEAEDDDAEFTLFRFEDEEDSPEDDAESADTWHSTGTENAIETEREPEEPKQFRLGKPKIGLPHTKRPKLGLPHKKDRTVIDVDDEPMGNPFEMGKGRRKKDNPFEK